jgi:chromosome segregation ATPase
MSNENQEVNEKYFNYYVETLTQTLNQQVLANVSALAKSKVNAEVLEIWQKENESLNQKIEQLNTKNQQIQDELNAEIENLKNSSLASQTAREEKQSEEIDKLKNIINSKNEQLTDEIDRLNDVINSKNDNIKNLQNDINRLNSIVAENEKVKHQLGHLETFRTELNKAREELNTVRNDYEKKISGMDDSYQAQIKELNDKIEYLQLTPAKRKKIEEVKTKESTDTPVFDVFSDTEVTLKDGGSF